MKKLLLSLGAVATAVAPIATVISCGDKTNGIETTVMAGGYGAIMNEVGSTKNVIVGSWGDSRFYAGKNAKNISVVGVVNNRISNDGIEARPGMKSGDEHASQLLFIKLIEEANKQKTAYKTANPSKFEDYTGDKSLLLEKSGKIATIFEVYSHSGYTPTADTSKASYINKKSGKIEERKAFTTNGGNFAPKAEATAEFFEKGDQISSSDWTDFKTKKTIKIAFIPSNDPKLVKSATEKLKIFLTSKSIDANITVTSDYDTAATSLENKQFDLAFLPIDTWVTKAPHANLIVQAARPTQVATLNYTNNNIEDPKGQTLIKDEKFAAGLINKYGQLYLKDATTAATSETTATEAQKAFAEEAKKDGTPEKAIQVYADKLSPNAPEFLAGQYEAWLYMNNTAGSIYTKIQKAIAEKGNDWTLPIADVKELKYYGTSKTSSASWVYPQLWIKKHIIK